MTTASPRAAAWRSVGLALAVVCAATGRAQATGFFINQQSVKGIGRVDAGNTVAADDLGTIFFNPAGLLAPDLADRQLPGGRSGERLLRPNSWRPVTSVALYRIEPGSDQRDRGSVVSSPGTLGLARPLGGSNAHNATAPALVPNVYAAVAPTEALAFGVGLNFPFGLKTSFDRGWHGRYDATEASLTTTNLTGVATFRVNTRLSVGGGVNWQRVETLLASAIPNPLTPGGPTVSTDGEIRTEGTGAKVGLNGGLLYDIDARTRVGVHYRAGMSHELSGTARISGLQGVLAAANGSTAVTANLDLPSIMTAGVRRRVGAFLLFGEFEWFDWSSFREVRIAFADGRPDVVRPSNDRDAYAVALGAERPFDNGWALRWGVHRDTTPTVDGFRDTTVPDSSRLWLGAGVSGSWRRLQIAGAFNYVFFGDTQVALTRTFFDNTPLATSVTINNAVSSVVKTIAIDLRYAWYR